VYLYGCKPRHMKLIHRQVRALKRRHVTFLKQAKTYKF
jgi:hypothetical protein